MPEWLKESCENIDAAMFSGEAFEEIDNIIELRSYIGRWERQMKRNLENMDGEL